METSGKINTNANKATTTMNTINWNFEGKTRTAKLKNIRVRQTLKGKSSKGSNYTITIPKVYYDNIGSPDFICFGVGDAGIFITNKPVGTQFRPQTKSLISDAKIFCTSEVVKSILKKMGRSLKTSCYVDFSLRQINDNVWQFIDVENDEFGFNNF